MPPIALLRADAGFSDSLSPLLHRALTTTTTPLAQAWEAVKRDTPHIISATYAGLYAGPLPGNVAGIVLGSVAAALICMYLLYLCFNIGGAPARSSVEDIGVEVVQRHTTSRSRSAPSRRRSRSRSEVIEVRSPPRRRERERVRETIVMEESRESRRSNPPREEEEDIVEVIEEHSPSRSPPRRHSRRVSSSAYRNVDPDEFAGGDRPLRHMRH